MDLEVQQHLKDHLSHRVLKNIQDSIRYLYSIPITSYSKLMVAALKVESKNEIWDKVKASAAMTTNPGKDTTELGQQIAKLMTALTRAGQGGSLANALNSPKREAMGGDGQTGILLAAAGPIMARLVLDTLPQAATHVLATEQGLP